MLLLALSCLVLAATLPAGFDETVRRARERFHVPGMGIAVVRDGETVLAQGYGLADVASGTPVDRRTAFAIASNSKAFTAAALALLVDDGRLAWDDRVVDHLPAFRLSDPYVTHELTVRDLLVHRSGLGLGAGDLLWWPDTTRTVPEIVARLRHVPLATSFRSAYAYDNVLYLVAGQVVEAVSGTPWPAFVRDRILRPLGMDDSATTLPEALANGRLASPYGEFDGRVQRLRRDDTAIVSSAGGVYSTARDMARWLLVRLGGGALPGGTRLYSPAQAAEMAAPTMPMPPESVPEALRDVAPAHRAYALGVVVETYRGRPLLTHNGVLAGMFSTVCLLPQSGAGVAILSNGPSMEALFAVRNALLDSILGAEPRDWVATYGRIVDDARATVASTQDERAARRDAASRPHLALREYAGDYDDPWYGRVAIREEGGALTIRFAHTPSLVGALEPWQHETFVARWHDRTLDADAFVAFTLTPEGRVGEARMAPASPTVDFSFDFADLRLKRVGDGEE